MTTLREHLEAICERTAWAHFTDSVREINEHAVAALAILDEAETVERRLQQITLRLVPERRDRSAPWPQDKP